MTGPLNNSNTFGSRYTAGLLARAIVYATLLAAALDATDGVIFFGLHGLTRSMSCSTSAADCWVGVPLVEVVVVVVLAELMPEQPVPSVTAVKDRANRGGNSKAGSL